MSLYRNRLECSAFSIIPNFNPRTPCGVRPSSIRLKSASINFNPRTPCGVRPLIPSLNSFAILFQSTHPVRGATADSPSPSRNGIISIHAPRAGCDYGVFADTHDTANFNPRTPCGVRRYIVDGEEKSLQFQSTHPVRGATTQTGTVIPLWIFQSTHPVRGATTAVLNRLATAVISIHAPRAGCDFQKIRA